jgi:BirA family biotin operon repressor/biotin-[acetyl-CoA-carboxylase] ligase
VTAFSSERFDLARYAGALAEIRAHRVTDSPCGPSPLLGDVVIALGRVGSTQEEARALVRAGAPHGTIVLAEEQTHGRGRRGRAWVSPRGTGLWATVILRRGLPEQAPQGLTLAAAVGVCEAAQSLGAGVEIKWPNDVVAAAGKVAGVLGEMLSTDGGSCALLGVGVNYDWGGRIEGEGVVGAVPAVPGPPEVDQEASDLRASGLRAGAGREEVLAAIVGSLEDAAAAAGSGRLAEVLDRWRRLSPSSAGRRVRVDETGGEPIRGTTRGIAPDGSLLVEDDGGVTHIVRFGGTLRFEAAAWRNADASDH